MKFIRQDNYYEKSDCGKYTVSAARVGDSWMFSGWKFGPPHVLLGSFVKADDARAACAADADPARKVA